MKVRPPSQNIQAPFGDFHETHCKNTHDSLLSRENALYAFFP